MEIKVVRNSFKRKVRRGFQKVTVEKEPTRTEKSDGREAKQA